MREISEILKQSIIEMLLEQKAHPTIEDRAEEIVDAAKALLDTFGTLHPLVRAREMLNNIGDDFKRSPDFKKLGQGAFRETFIHSSDASVVVKIARNDKGLLMNLDDAQLGRRSDLAIVFPKTFAYDKDGFWIVQERARTVKNVAELDGYFKDVVIGDRYDWDNVMIALDLAAFEKKARAVIRPEAREFANELVKDPLFRQWVKAHHELKFDVSDLDIRNIGWVDEGRLVIIDSSLHDRIWN